MEKLDEYETYISIIIPVYNCEEKLENAVNSVLRQPFKDIEIIIVDDGSSDTTGNIADRLCAKTERLTVFHQKNKGVSSARNTGIFKAKGKYVMFLDVEDEYVDGAIDQDLAKKCMDNYGVIMCSSLVFNNDCSRCAIDACWNDKLFTGEKDLLIDGYFAACLYNRDILVKNNIFFGQEIYTNEDFKMKALFASDRIWTDKRFLYIYNMPSCPGVNTDKDICDVIRGWRATYNWLNEHESMANATHNRILVLQKIVSSVLDYAKYYVRKGNDKNSLFSELEKLDVIELIQELPEKNIPKEQRREFNRLKNHMEDYARNVRIREWKIKIGQVLLKINLFRKMCEKKKFPLERKQVDGPYIDFEKANMNQKLKNHKRSIIIMTIIIILLIGIAAVFPLGYTVALIVLIGIIALLIAGIPSTVFYLGPDYKFNPLKHIAVIIIIAITIGAIYSTSSLRHEIVYYFAVLLPIMLIQILYPLSIVKYSLNIARVLSLILMYSADYIGMTVFVNSKFVDDAIVTSLVFDCIFAFYRANFKRTKEEGNEE